MTNEEAKSELMQIYMSLSEEKKQALDVLMAQADGEYISRQAVDTLVDELARAISDERCCISRGRSTATIMQDILDLSSVNPQEQIIGHCKDCKYFEYDSVAKVDGIPLIVAHEICSKWGDGCKTKEDGYCFLYEPQEMSDRNLKMWHDIYEEEKRREGNDKE